MPRPTGLRVLSEKELSRVPGFKLRKRTTKIPKRAVARAQVRAATKRWQAQQRVPSISVRESALKGVRLGMKDLNVIRRVAESDAPTAEIIGAKVKPEQFLGTLHSALTAHEYAQMQGEFKKRLRGASALQRVRVLAQWKQVVKAASQAYASAGVARVTERELNSFSTALRRNRSNFNAIVKIANTGQVEAGATTTRRVRVTGAWVPTVEVFRDPTEIATSIAKDLCDEPIEGKYTKHLSRSFNLRVKLRVWCPTWTNPFRTCKKTFTIAGVSFSVGLEVGYRVTCCGATAWGQAHARACGTIIGITVCAGCTAKLVAVAGVGRTGSGSSCTYGFGVNAELKCTLAGITVFRAQVPFGWNISGPCPPKPLPC